MLIDRMSITTRQKLAKLTLPVLIALSFALMLVGKADAVLASRLRTALQDRLTPVYLALAAPLRAARDLVTGVEGFVALHEENERLRAENDALRHWQTTALALAGENEKLKASLNWTPEPPAEFITAPVVADAGGTYARAVLLATGPTPAVRKGDLAFDSGGLAGRVTEVGTRSARVMLITDLNSRIPVVLETTQGRAIVVGTNGPHLRLLYASEGKPPQEGERVLTSGVAGVFPPDLAVGTIRYSPAHVAEVEPMADLDHFAIARVVDYGSLPPPDPAPARAADGRRG